MTTMAATVVALAIINFTFKAAGPAVLGDRACRAPVHAVLDTLPVALLAALITVDLLGARWTDADPTMVPGLITAGIARRRHAPDVVCIVAGVAVTAGLRAVT